MEFPFIKDIVLKSTDDYVQPEFINPNRVALYKDDLENLLINQDYVYIEIEEFIVKPPKVITKVNDVLSNKKTVTHGTSRGLVLAIGERCSDEFKAKIEVGDTIYVKSFDYTETLMYTPGKPERNPACHTYSFTNIESKRKLIEEEGRFCPHTGLVREHEIVGIRKPKY